MRGGDPGGPPSGEERSGEVLYAWFCSELGFKLPISILPTRKVPFWNGGDRNEGPFGGGDVDEFLQALRRGVISPQRLQTRDV